MASMLALVAEGGKMIGDRGSLLFDAPSFHQKTRRWLSTTYPDAVLLLLKMPPPKLFLK